MKKKDLNIIKELDTWMKIDGINGIALSEKEGKVCIVVSYTKNIEHIKKLIPEMYKGYKIYIEFVNDFIAF